MLLQHTYRIKAMKENYIFHSTSFDKELLRKQIIILTDNFIDYKLVTNSVRPPSRSPLGGYFETEIHILEKDFERADKLLLPLIEQY